MRTHISYFGVLFKILAFFSVCPYDVWLIDCRPSRIIFQYTPFPLEIFLAPLGEHYHRVMGWWWRWRCELRVRASNVLQRSYLRFTELVIRITSRVNRSNFLEMIYGLKLANERGR